MTLRWPDDSTEAARRLAAEFGRSDSEVRDLIEAAWSAARRKKSVGDWWTIAIKAARRKLERNVPVGEGPRLFAELRSYVAKHLNFAEPWHLDLYCVFLMQCALVGALPGVFYLFVGGRFASGKTSALRLAVRLAGGTLVENVSVAALARMLDGAGLVALDEVDVPRGAEFDAMRDSLLRAGYRRGDAQYTRYDPKTRQLESVPVFGPKICSFRGTLDPALASRGYVIPSSAPTGVESYGLIVQNLYPEQNDLPVRLSAWGRARASEWTAEKIRSLLGSEAFQTRVKEAVPTIGANRNSELATYVLLVTEVAGVDIGEDLLEASAAREIVIEEEESEDLAEMASVILSLTSSRVTLDQDPDSWATLEQRTVRLEVNARRKSRGERPLSNKEFATLRREAGILDKWITNVHGALRWTVPPRYLARLGGGDTSPGEANPPHLPAPGGGVGGVEGGVGSGVFSEVKGGVGGVGGVNLEVSPRDCPVMEESANWTVSSRDRQRRRVGEP